MPKIEIKRDGTLISGSFTDEEKNSLWEQLVKETLKRHPEIIAEDGR